MIFYVGCCLLFGSVQAEILVEKPTLRPALPQTGLRSLMESPESVNKSPFATLDDECNDAFAELAENPEKTSNSYQCVKGGYLGEGSFGAVFTVKKVLPQNTVATSTTKKKDQKHDWEVRVPTNNPKNQSPPASSSTFAMKLINQQNDEDIKRIQKEFEILKKMETVNFIRVEEIIVLETRVLLFMEMATNGDFYDYHFGLYSLLKPSDPIWIFFYFKQMVKAMVDFHKKGFVWRDLKMQNMVVSGHLVKMIDFDTAITLKAKANNFLGTSRYQDPAAIIDGLKPEDSRIKEKPFDPVKIQNPKYVWDYYTDIYNLGVVLYEISFKKLPFEAPQEWKESPIEELMAAKLNGLVIIPKGTHVALTYLLSQMLLLEPSHRPQAWQVLYIIHTLGPLDDYKLD